MTKVCFSLFLYRHILAALHFNYNLHRDDKVNEDNSVPVKLSYPKFKNGEATVRSQKVEQNFGKQITCIKNNIDCNNTNFNKFILSTGFAFEHTPAVRIEFCKQ